eukprot:CAMPEP_0185596666 /NCGR_PEP_ID=MMETSP0434-20130131/80892_1 /TAXON_ID=626734 ORGANISM="Favella taraikaensis, Strain Fe Narragansett Bay" /NCGR_SAMPLE_ID=MMETSP0434 /ASSEMBLY_ACC=CAM_ASM_000379 /LENGTH=47 /DNA_ID= /DNA_START= /DNA_END= /DNA_ORIENTATION=
MESGDSSDSSEFMISSSGSDSDKSTGSWVSSFSDQGEIGEAPSRQQI